MKMNCTTCGAVPFRRALWASAAASCLDGAAEAIVDQLRNLARPPLDVEAVRFVIYDLYLAIGRARVSELGLRFLLPPPPVKSIEGC